MQKDNSKQISLKDFFELKSFETFFETLVHPSYIFRFQYSSSNQKITDVETGDIVVNEILTQTINSKNGLKYKELLKSVFYDETLIEEIYEESYKLFDSATYEKKEDKKISKFKAEGIKTKFKENDGTPIFVDFYSIPHINRGRGSRVIGFQAFMPKVNLRRKEYLNSLREANLNALSTIIAYNQTHTDGSHVMLDTEKWLNAIQKKARDCYSKVFQEKCKEKRETYLQDATDYFNLFDTQFKNYNEHLILLKETCDTINHGFEGNSYFSYKFQEVFEEFIEKLFSEEIGRGIKEKFLGRGLNDGTANSVIKLPSRSRKNIVLPLGDIGKASIIIILKNIFRNLKKHSESNKNLELNSFYKKINLKETQKPVYELSIDLKELDNEHLKNDYYAVECTEISNLHTKEYAEKIKENLNTEFEKQFKYDDLGSAWGLKEMKIFASFLIGYPLYEISIEKNKNDGYSEFNEVKFPFSPINVEIEEADDSKYKIKHIFYLKKEKFATVYLDKKHEEHKNIKRFVEAGFDFRFDDKRIFHSSSKFIIGLKDNEGELFETRKSFNFRLVNFEFNIESDPDTVRKEIENKWIRDIRFKTKAIFCEGEILNLIDNQLIDNEPQPLAVIDNHFEELKKKINDQEDFELYKEYNYLEEHTTNRSNCIRKYRGNEIPNYLKLEAINTKIAIIDERIQDYIDNGELSSNLTLSESNKLEGIKLKDFFKLKGIYTLEDNLNNYFYPEEKGDTGDLNDFIEKLKDPKKPFKECDYIIIHFSGFEKLAERDPDFKDIESNKNELVKKAYEKILKELEIKNTNRFIVFTSGKTPPTLPKGSLFISYSTLNRVLRDKSKIELVDVLNSIRTKK